MVIQCSGTDRSHGLACGPSRSWALCGISVQKIGALQTWYQSLRLLAEQVKMMQKFPSAIASLPMSNGCNISPKPAFEKLVLLSQVNVFSFITVVHQNSTCGAAENVGTAAESNDIMHEPVHADRPNAFSNNSSSPSNMGLRQTIDGRIIKKEPVYGGNSPFTFGPHGSYLESRSAMGDASVSSFSSVESNRKPLNEPLLDADTTSFGFLGEMPQFWFLKLDC
ncbi:hypothetical protein CQW23_31144 [Capsicum baccatum]|uniref:Uncharacterized protein n=1 Tax=Capsicum baccatum TaxID=33114 RepID=A0A2G2V8F9_CAPBA|nr:hypothetical protein CQW23_31144 [Capsicum baccatum]